MKKEILILFFALLVIPAVYAQVDNEIYYSTYLILNSEISSSIDIIEQPGANIDYVKSELYFFPKDDERQTVLEIETEPEAVPSEESFLFQWDSPEEDSLDYKVSSKIRVENKFEKVYEKIPFPLEGDIPSRYAKYLNPTPKIDSESREIRNLANALAEGEDDLFIVIHNFADWVYTNIEYDLNTVTAEASQKASWVLLYRQGVCDELTALFIAMCRSVGIPSRFVSGVSYTNDPQFAEKWGPHGWAEVYLPGHGWVPFDVTYSELGWIDPSHIKLSDGVDPDRPSGRIEWKGNNFDVKGGKFQLDTSIEETGGRILDTVAVTSKVHKKKVGFGSYNLLEVNIRNLREYYVTTDISVSVPEEVKLFGNKTINIILNPLQTKRFFWILKVDENLDREYSYSLPALAYNQRNTSDQKEFKALQGEAVYSYEEMEEIISERDISGEEVKEVSKDMDISCSVYKARFYASEQNSVSCTIKNKGNTYIENIKICLNDNCDYASLGISEEKNIEFKFSDTRIGEREIAVTAGNNEVSAEEKMQITVLDSPELSISNIEYPAEIKYNEKANISFVLTRESFSDVKNIAVEIENRRISSSWNLENLNQSKRFVLEFEGNNLKSGNNLFIINVDYEDSRLRKFYKQEKIEINLVDLSFTQKMITFFKGFLSIF